MASSLPGCRPTRRTNGCSLDLQQPHVIQPLVGPRPGGAGGIVPGWRVRPGRAAAAHHVAGGTAGAVRSRHAGRAAELDVAQPVGLGVAQLWRAAAATPGLAAAGHAWAWG